MECLKDIRLKKGMNKNNVNESIDEWIELEDDIYLGTNYKHNWRCKCGNIIEGRAWATIRRRMSIDCEQCKYKKIEQRYKYEVEKTGEYLYIRSYRTGYVFENGKKIKNPFLEVMHRYCGNKYIIESGSFINSKDRCGKCCQKYEKSFAYHIEKELNEPLEKYWDFDKNTVNPYMIFRSGAKHKVWIKCTNPKTPYHGSYDTLCETFIRNRRCSYCSGKKTHPYDSFGYHNFDKVMSWHPDNEISPFRIGKNSGKKYKFICETCGLIFEKRIADINSKGYWCENCSSSNGEKKTIKFLRVNNIEFIHDETYFKDLLSDKGNLLRPDFILPEHKIWIEYDGEFHFKKYYKGQNFEEMKINDKRKNKYAKKHGWNLIRIPYWDYDNIDDILNKELLSNIIY